MVSNTANLAICAANVSEISVENQSYKCEPFLTHDGHFIGADGFVVPKDFNEFLQRFPEYVRKWVSKHASKGAQRQDIEDWTQDLTLHLSSLPSTSKHRNSGKEDIIQTFDPSKHFGASQARFQNYVNLCLANKFRTMHAGRRKDALCRNITLSLLAHSDCEDYGAVGDEYCHSHSSSLRKIRDAFEKQASDALFLKLFIDFIRREDVSLLPVIEVIKASSTLSDAFAMMGPPTFTRALNRLRTLADCFQNGKRVPKQRKPYKPRIRKPVACVAHEA